jgi:hypothetical protein
MHGTLMPATDNGSWHGKSVATSHFNIGGILKKLLAPVVLVLLATGCGATPTTTQGPTSPADVARPTETATAAPTTMKPGSFTIENATGTKGIIQIPAEPVAEIEKLRALVKGPGVTYLTVKFDNRQGTVGVNMYGVTIFTPAGEELKYTNANAYIDSIRPSDAPAEVYNQFIDVGDKHMEMANPKGVKDVVLTGPAVPDEITGITVYPTGMSDPVEAVPSR